MRPPKIGTEVHQDQATSPIILNFAPPGAQHFALANPIQLIPQDDFNENEEIEK
jgi:hypothetical protein